MGKELEKEDDDEDEEEEEEEAEDGEMSRGRRAKRSRSSREEGEQLQQQQSGGPRGGAAAGTPYTAQAMACNVCRRSTTQRSRAVSLPPPFQEGFTPPSTPSPGPGRKVLR
eukprot:1979256-Pyramimonas_sp.AAC.1